VAHTDDVAFIAITDDGCELGVDVESWREISATEMASVLTPSERRDVLSAPAPQKSFFDLWTRKEAILKANGAGLGGITSRFGTMADLAGMAASMHVENLPAGLEHSAALAVDCRTVRRPPTVRLRARHM
jgi:4'-phosphopantetheinyl transferase